MLPLLLIGCTVGGFALGVYFGRNSVDLTDLYDVPYGEDEGDPL